MDYYPSGDSNQNTEQSKWFARAGGKKRKQNRGRSCCIYSVGETKCHSLANL